MTKRYSAFVVLALVPVIPFLLLPSFGQEAKKDKEQMPEPARFWSGLANNDKLEPWQRAMALYFLFDRHIGKDVALRDLAKSLDRPVWMKENDVRLIEKLAGWVPVKLTFDDSIFEISVFTNKDTEKHNRESIGIYIRVSGDMDKNTFFAIVAKGEKHKDENRKIKEWGIAPTLKEYAKRMP